MDPATTPRSCESTTPSPFVSPVGAAASVGSFCSSWPVIGSTVEPKLFARIVKSASVTMPDASRSAGPAARMCVAREASAAWRVNLLYACTPEALKIARIALDVPVEEHPL